MAGILDFYSPEYRLGIEADGGQHYENKGKQKDEFRTRELSKLGVEILRFSDREILTNIEGIYEMIKRTLDEKRGNLPSPQSSPHRGEEVKQFKNSPHLPKKLGKRGEFLKMTPRKCSIDAGLRGGGEVRKWQVRFPNNINVLGVL